MSYNLDNFKELENLSPEERELTLQILRQLSTKGQSKLLDDLKYADFDEIPVDIETFLTDPRYLGKGLINEDGKFTVFPYWVDILKKIFPDNLTTKYNTVVLTGPIGIGKSFEAVLILLYLLHRMLCLKDPYLYYGLQPIDKITFSMLNITLDAAQGVAWDKCQQLIQSSEWFMSKGEINKSRTNPVWQPGKRIELIYGSSNNHIIGRALFCNFTDECLDGDTLVLTENGYSKIKDLENKQTKFVTFNPESNQLELSNQAYVQETVRTKDYYEIELEDGTIIKCTPTHRLLLKDGTYKYAKDLLDTDELMDVPTKHNLSYYEYIQNIINTRGQWNIDNSKYFEAHHILPCCLGGLPARNESLAKYKKIHHDNIIWLYPEEHFEAHRLLALEHPDIYGLQAAWTFTSVDKNINELDYKELKENRRKLPKDLLKNIDTYKETKFKKRKIINRKTSRDTTKNKAEIARRKLLGIQGNKGSKNGMFNNGHKVSGGLNGHANMLYYYKNEVFQSRKDLVTYLQVIDNRITCSVIYRLVKGLSTLRAYNKFKDIFDNLSWRYKDED